MTDVYSPMYFDLFYQQQCIAKPGNALLSSDQTTQTKRSLSMCNNHGKSTAKPPQIHNGRGEQERARQAKYSGDYSTVTRADVAGGECERGDHGGNVEHVVILDWDDTLMATSYLLSFIEYEVEEHPVTKKKKIKTFTLSEQCTAEELKEFITNLDKAGNAAYRLLVKVLKKFKTENVKIITNGEHGWLPESLRVAGTFCHIFKKIEYLLCTQFPIDIIYARNYNLKQSQWKTKCYDRLLWQYFAANDQSHSADMMNVNIVTIGDQWTDHHSITQSLTYSIYGEYIKHHQIKLFENPSCRYLCAELNYIASLFDEEVFFKFHAATTSTAPSPAPLQHCSSTSSASSWSSTDSGSTAESTSSGHADEEQQGLLLEFDGYNE
eukprot:CAMPEP_0197040428 /NCGR_PEP_ID=MMETSP1384-20130603/17119_1 /TAXON_ID=29189 /ORGANISM="Ammonia sp." /LENGTH=379 /DNA_ID=CAMNT_0042471179 /DNA_START=206 /DNA_END=1345 /DNA_ORIENTATION=+